jgi:branched-subunit amino acid ABC-type transport system permease component
MVGVLGNNINRMRTFVFGLGSALAGIAGVIAAPLWSVRPGMGNDAIMPAFVIVVLGGIGSFWGTVIGGVAVGLSISLAVMFLPRMSDLVMYILAAFVLLFWPRGIMGEKSILEE